MAIYHIEWKKSALKDLKRLDKKAIPKIVEQIEKLAGDPFSGDVRKLQAAEYTYRLRVGQYRVVYEIIKDKIIIIILHVRHRKDAYR